MKGDSLEGSARTPIYNPHILPLRMFIERGASCNSPSWLGETPLHAAAQFAQTPVIQYLLDQGDKVICFVFGFKHHEELSTNTMLIV